MESCYNTSTGKYFDVPDDDFDKFQNIFSEYEPRTYEDALFSVEDANFNCLFSREYTKYEIYAIFDVDCEYSGIDVEIKKDKVSPLGNRLKAEEELKTYINSKGDKKITIKSAKELLKILKAFDSIEYK